MLCAELLSGDELLVSFNSNDQCWPWKKNIRCKKYQIIVCKMLQNDLHKVKEVLSSHSLIYSIQEFKSIQRVKKCRQQTLTYSRWTQAVLPAAISPQVGFAEARLLLRTLPPLGVGAIRVPLVSGFFYCTVSEWLLSRQAVFRPRTATLLKWKRSLCGELTRSHS